MRRLDPLTPDEARELDALDRALAGDPVDPSLRELEELVSDIRATAPAMSPAFAARLQRDVEDGFPEPSESPRLRRPRHWVLLPAGGVLAAALVALVVALGQGGGSPVATPNIAQAPQEAARDAGGSAGSAPADSAATSSGDQTAAPHEPDTLIAPGGVAAAPAPAARLQAAPSPSVAKSGVPRKVVRSAELSLEAPFAQVGKVSDDVIRTVDRFGGIVASSSIDDAGGASSQANFDLRIPTGRLDDALAALSKLGHVANRTQNLQDITSSFTSVQDRLSDARAERRGLLRALAAATTQAQIDSLKARLRDSASTISRLDGDLASLRRRADLSTVNLSITGVGKTDDGATGGGGNWSPGDAAGDALRVLEVIAGVTLIALAIGVPLGLLGLAIALAARSSRRRGRERALDPA